MGIKVVRNLACPLDGGALEFADGYLVCANRHSFDVSRHGYVNLLPVQLKRTKAPGDSKEMIAARRQFLNGHYYQKISDKLQELVATSLDGISEPSVLDVGCGEGYYTERCYDHLIEKRSTSEISVVGVDISKWAVQQAAKRTEKVTWLVATNRQLPILSHSIDVVISVFGFANLSEVNRVLHEAGIFILVEPGPLHLIELREIIYPKIKPHIVRPIAWYKDHGFNSMSRHLLTYKIRDVCADALGDLLLMTPHFYRASKSGRQVVESLDSMDLSVDVVFDLYQTRSSTIS